MLRKTKQRQVEELAATDSSCGGEKVGASIDTCATDDVSKQNLGLGQDDTQRPKDVDNAVFHEQSYAGLLPLLDRLDERLTAAVDAAEQVFAARAAGDLYRGLAITPADVAAAFRRTLGQPFLSLSMQAHKILEATKSLSLRRLLWLQSVYGLTNLDLDIILIGLRHGRQHSALVVRSGACGVLG